MRIILFIIAVLWPVSALAQPYLEPYQSNTWRGSAGRSDWQIPGATWDQRATRYARDPGAEDDFRAQRRR
jgi:hypothetical protein